MRKILGAVLVLTLALAAIPAKADILRNVKTTGEIQVIGTLDHHMPDLNTGDRTGQYSLTSVRVLYGIKAGLTENVAANLTLAYYNLWGQDAKFSGQTATSHTGSSIFDYSENIDVVEANVVLKNLFCCLEAKIGRQFYGDENSAIIYFGPNHYNSEQSNTKQAQSIDGVNLGYVGEALSWNFLYAKINQVVTAPNGPSSGTQDDSTTLLGIDGKYDINENVGVQAYFYQFRNAAAAFPIPFDKYIGIYGVKPSFKFGNIDLSVEYARNVGSDKPFKHDKGDFWKVDAALDLGDITPRAQFVRGNEFSAFGNYRPGLIFGQIITNFDVINGTSTFEDIAVINLGVDMKFPSIDKFTFVVDGFYFSDRNLKTEPVYELDGWVKYQATKAVELHVAVGGAHEDHEQNSYKAQTGMLIRF